MFSNVEPPNAKYAILLDYPNLCSSSSTTYLIPCRLIYAKKKLTHTQKQQLERVLDHVSFSCGTQLQDYSDLPQDMMDMVFARNLNCNEPIERLYYSAKFADICVHCSSESVSPWNDSEEFYPQCEGCSEKSKIANTNFLGRKPLHSTVTLFGPL